MAEKEVTFDDIIELLATRPVPEVQGALTAEATPLEAATRLNQLWEADIDTTPWELARGKQNWWIGPHASFRNPEPMGQAARDLFPLPPALRVPGAQLPELLPYPTEMMAKLGKQQEYDAYLRDQIENALRMLQFTKRGEKAFQERSVAEAMKVKKPKTAVDEQIGKLAYSLFKQIFNNRPKPEPMREAARDRRLLMNNFPVGPDMMRPLSRPTVY